MLPIILNIIDLYKTVQLYLESWKELADDMAESNRRKKAEK